jgi:hypothetical protein
MSKAVVIGGPGRSGTSLLRNWFLANPHAVSFGPNVESKFFVEAYGLIDLYRAFVSDYSYSRAIAAVREFKALMLTHLVDSTFCGQPEIDAFARGDQKGRRESYKNLVTAYIDSLHSSSAPLYLSDVEFFQRTSAFVEELLSTYVKEDQKEWAFIEKTPHNCLNPWIFLRLFKDVRFVWVVRDPRAIVYSTYKMHWGPTSIDASIVYTKALLKRFVEIVESNECLMVKLEELDQVGVVEGIQNFCEFGLRPGVEPFNIDVINDWKARIRPDDLIRVEEAMRAEVEYFGY